MLHIFQGMMIQEIGFRFTPFIGWYKMKISKKVWCMGIHSFFAVTEENMETQNYLIRLIEVSNRKYKLLENMFQTYLLQAESLCDSNYVSPEEQVQNRQSMMEEVDKLDEQFHVYTERLKTTFGILSLDELARFSIPGRVELKEVVGRISNMLEELSDRHRKTESQMQEVLLSTGSQIRQVTVSKQMNRAYQPVSTMPPPSVFFDKKK